MNSKPMSDEEAVCECGHSRNSHHNGRLSCVHGSKEWCNCEKYIPKPPTGEGVEGEQTFEQFWNETVKWGHASDYSDTYQNKKALAHRAWNAAKGIK